MWFGLLAPVLGTALGAGAVFGMGPGSRRSDAALAGTAAGAMAAAGIWSLLLPAVESGRGEALTGFLLGLLALLLPERLPRRRLSPGGVVLLAVVLHNIPEGLAVGAEMASDQGGGLIIGIALQNIPDGAVAALPLAALGMGRGRAFAAGVLTGLVEPVAALGMVAFAPGLTGLLPGLMGFAAGAMCFVILGELAPKIGGSGWGIVCFAVSFVLMAR